MTTGPHWTRRAACRHTPGLHVNDARGVLATQLAAKAVHACRHHCPVFEECAELAREHTPSGVVQAGIRYGAWRGGSRGRPTPTQPHDVACSKSCEVYV